MILVLRQTEIPVEQQTFALGVANDPLPVAAVLRIVGGEKEQARQDPLTEVLDQVAITEVRIDSPVGGDRAQVDHAYVPSGGSLLGLLLRHGVLLYWGRLPEAVGGADHGV